MTSTVVAQEVPPTCHALSAENKLVIAPGLLSGSAAAMSGRISVGCKSPLTGGIKEANSGGQPSQMLARLGYAAIILEGRPKDDTLYKVVVNKDGVTVTADNSLKMLGNYDLVEKMKAEFGDKIGCISIGPAGEMKMSAATVAFTDMEGAAHTPCRAWRGRRGDGRQRGQGDRHRRCRHPNARRPRIRKSSRPPTRPSWPACASTR
jgi:aldehyde:ferredoxin oxidoreductase